ncbi:hypothetical protein D6D05_08133 [Aureobasidium pullulans]|nr:hypothetical protein D6D05_08133 [Aureobasidium pullulans]
MLVATDIPGWAKPCFLHIGYVEEDQNHGVWCGGVPVLCLVPGTLRRSGIRSSRAEDLPLIVSPASGASRHIVLHSSNSLRISSHDVQNRTTYSLGRTLADYDLQHSGEENEFTETTNSRPAPQGAGNNPADCEDNFRRVPDYRPVDHELDFAYRDTTQNGIERAFIWNMFSGIVLTSYTNRLWRATGGKLNDTYFRWQVGGEH